MKKILLPALLFVFTAFAYGQTVVDLTDDPSEYGLYDAINDATGPIEVILNPEVEYVIESRRVLHNLIVRSEPDGPPAKIKIFDGNFWLGEVSIDSLVFDNVHIVGDGYGSYIFNNGNSYSIDKVVLKNSRFQNLGGLIRGKAESGSIGSYTVDNCLIDTLDEYSIVNMNSTCSLDELTVSNTTVYHAACVFNMRSQSPNTITLENLTIHEGNDVGHWLYGMFLFPNEFNELTFNNVLIGPGIGGTVGVLEAPEGANINVTNSYYTSNLQADESFPVPDGFEAYTGTSDDLWADPASGDFTISDNDFDAKFTAGDPRWIPARLDELSVNAGDLSPEFDPSVLSYTCDLPAGTDAVVVTAVAAHEGATVSGDGIVDVSSGSGTANVVVLEGSISQTYTIEFSVEVGIDEDLKDQVDLYYNSFSDEVVIKNLNTAEQLQKVEIFSLSGQVIRSYMIEDAQQQTTVGTSDLGSGMYILRGSFSNDASVYLKFIK